MNSGKVVGLTALAVIAATPAMAQDGRRLKIDLGVQAVHDTNVARTDKALAATRRIVPEDTIISPTLTVDIVNPVGRQALFLKGAAGYSFYDKNEILDSERIDLEGGIVRKFSSCGTVLSAKYKRNRSQLEDLVLEPVDNIETRTGGELKVDCTRAIGLSPSGSISYEKAENSESSREIQDYENSSASLGLAYSRPTLGTLGVFGLVERTIYDKRVPAAGVDEEGYEAWSVGLRYTRRLGARIETVFAISQTALDALEPDASDFDGITYRVDLTYRPSSRLETRLAFERAARPSQRLDADYTIEESWRGDVAYTLSPRLRVTMSATQSESDYEISAGSPVAALSNDRIRSISGAVHAKFSRRLSLVFDATHEERDADLAAYSYDSTRVGVTAALSY